MWTHVGFVPILLGQNYELVFEGSYKKLCVTNKLNWCKTKPLFLWTMHCTLLAEELDKSFIIL